MKLFGTTMAFWWWMTLMIVYLTFFVFDSHALTCYQCRSSDGQCKTGQCVTNGGVCSKREKNYGNGTWTVIKGCRNVPARNRTCEYDQTLAPGGQICFCDSADYCNSAYSTIRHYKFYGPLLLSIAFSLIRWNRF